MISSPGGGEGSSSAIRTIRGHCIESIGDSEDPRAQRNLHSFRPRGVTGAIEAFLMGVHNLRGVARKGILRSISSTTLAVFAHDGNLNLVETSRLEEDGIGGCDLPNVVQKCAAGDRPQFIRANAEGSGQFDRICGYPLGVAFRLLVA